MRCTPSPNRYIGIVEPGLPWLRLVIATDCGLGIYVAILSQYGPWFYTRPFHRPRFRLVNQRRRR